MSNTKGRNSGVSSKGKQAVKTEVKTDAKVKKGKATKKTVFLTEEEKKRHHIESENKRRQAIRDAFEKLVALNPDLTPEDNRSEILILSKSADYLRVLLRDNKSLVEQLISRGITVEDRLKVEGLI